jgi:hypothetical protein
LATGWSLSPVTWQRPPSICAGIDADALATQLQEEGAKSFVKSWNDLMAVIMSKSAALTEAAAG